MARSRITIHTISSATDSFLELLFSLLQQYAPEATPLRLTFFSDIRNSATYYDRLDAIGEAVAAKFTQVPLISLVAQPPLGGVKLALEAEEFFFTADESIEYKQEADLRYLVLHTKTGKELLIAGASGNRDQSVMQQQAITAFEKIDRILTKETFPVDSIVRQWNYLERIIGFDADRQRYQGFNDARSAFYAKGTWANGYPAATGIGSYAGGVVIDLKAFLPKDPVVVIPIDNRLQIAAHVYSQSVLLGAKGEACSSKTTPKFERAKLIHAPGCSLLYVSGTAAIRGEESLQNDAALQTRITLENVAFLTDCQRQQEHGLAPQKLAPQLWRVYIKSASDYPAVQAVIEQEYPSVQTLYVEADVCRDELLMEIEGVATASN